MDSYYSISEISTGLYVEKASKFYSFLYPTRTLIDWKNSLEILQKQHHKARHICYAYRILLEDLLTKANDDGEPGGTAGKPILNQLEKFEIINCSCFVVRYFGGTLLGAAGLTRAYKAAAEMAIQSADLKLSFQYESLTIFCPPNLIHNILNIAKLDKNIRIIHIDQNNSLNLEIPKNQSLKFVNLLRQKFDPSKPEIFNKNQIDIYNLHLVWPE